MATKSEVSRRDRTLMSSTNRSSLLDISSWPVCVQQWRGIKSANQAPALTLTNTLPSMYTTKIAFLIFDSATASAMLPVYQFIIVCRRRCWWFLVRFASGLSSLIAETGNFACLCFSRNNFLLTADYHNDMTKWIGYFCSIFLSYRTITIR